MTPGSELPGGRPHRRLPIWVSAIGAAVIAIGIGIPVALLAGPGAGHPDGGGGSSSGSGGSDGTAQVSTPSPVPPPIPAPTVPPTTGPPSGLSADEADLWSSLGMDGVDRQSCTSYPDGETLNGVTASIQCAIQDSSISQPIDFHRFTDATTMNSYMTLRASEIVPGRVGDCRSGDESDTTWNRRIGDPRQGRMVCVDNTKNGTTYFKIVWASDAKDTAAIIQDEQPSDTWNWWNAHAAGQFGGG